MIGEDFSTVVLNFLNGGTLLPSINSTYIALIPKELNLDSVNEFRASLCKILYKIIAKKLAN